MSTILAYAIALFINMGVISPETARNTTSIQIIERNGHTVAVDSNTGSEVIIYM